VSLPHIYRWLIRTTPLVPVQFETTDPIVWCKLDHLNPSGSTKDRVAAAILGNALESNRLNPGQLVVEASSGSTSIAMAMVCAQLNIKFAAVMPQGVSAERAMIIRGYGAQVIYSDASRGVLGAMQHAREMARDANVYLPLQFENQDNVLAHQLGTAVEVASQLKEANVDRIDAFVSGVGTGGTLVGVYRGMVEQGMSPIPVVAKPVRHREAPVAGACFTEAECSSFSNRIPGVVDNLSKLYVPGELPKLTQVDVDDELAIQTTRRLIRLGFPVGPSSGLNYAAALAIARRLGRDAIVATIFADRMERYFSTELFKDLS
jgi:cysteine synthase A